MELLTAEELAAYEKKMNEIVEARKKDSREAARIGRQTKRARRRRGRR